MIVGISKKISMRNSEPTPIDTDDDNVEIIDVCAQPQTVFLHLHSALREERDKQFRKGRMMSTLDVGYFLDRTLEIYEREHGDTLGEDEFGVFIAEICEELLREKVIYEAGNRTSYIENVRNCALIAMQEAVMKKAIVGNNGDSSDTNNGSTNNESINNCNTNNNTNTNNAPGAVRHSVIFRDTEFPYDETTGMYIV
jgi:hypothetical protein